MSFYGKIEVLDLSDHVFTCKGARPPWEATPGPVGRSSSDPLVGELELLLETTDQGTSAGGHTMTARGSRAVMGQPGSPARVCGVYPIFDWSGRVRGSGSVLVVSGSGPGSGGDEETRTPDPLLAKEMLFRLSYVPLRPQGRRWWAFLDSNQRPLPYQGSALTS